MGTKILLTVVAIAALAAALLVWLTVGNVTTTTLRYAGKEKPVAYTPTTILRAMGISQSQYEALREGIADIENARYDEMGGAGHHFAGRYQMGYAEIRETAAALGEPVPTIHQFLTDPNMQERYFEAYTLQHHRILMHTSGYADAYVERKLEILGYAHNQGARGAASWWTTGVARKDAFGTSGEAYAKAVHKRLTRATHASGWTGHPLVFGDSIAHGVKDGAGAHFEGDAKDRRRPNAVLAALQHFPGGLRGKWVILSSGISNAPDQIEYVIKQLDLLTKAGAKVILLGVGKRPGFDELNSKLRDLAWEFNQKYAALTALRSDQVHPADYQEMLRSLQSLIGAT